MPFQNEDLYLLGYIYIKMLSYLIWIDIILMLSSTYLYMGHDDYFLYDEMYNCISIYLLILLRVQISVYMCIGNWIN